MNHSITLRETPSRHPAALRDAPSRLPGALLLGLLTMALVVAAPAGALISDDSTVYPVPAGKSKVQWRDFRWNTVDFGQNEDGEGGIRFFYYDAEEAIARRAIAVVQKDFDYLCKEFAFVPKQRVPYILYSSHQEFEQTNLFQISEHVLGVTSPADLKMSLAYWGRHRRFARVSLHEMVHQFTIQKVYEISKEKELRRSPLLEMPLWFIEGIAEYYAQGKKIDPETRTFARDMLYYPNEDRGYEAPKFFDDQIKSFGHTYKFGQLRLIYLAETYGPDVPQRILDLSYTLQPGDDFSSEKAEKVNNFRALVKDVTGVAPDDLIEDFQRWLAETFPPPVDLDSAAEQVVDAETGDRPASGEAPKGALAATGTQRDEVAGKDGEDEKAKPSYPRRPGMPEGLALERFGDAVDRFSLTRRDGVDLILYREISRDSGQTRLRLGPLTDADRVVTVVADQTRTVESLHFLNRPVADLDEHHLVFAGSRRGADVLYLQPYDVETSPEGEIDLRLGRRQEFRFDPIVEIGSPSFSPTGDAVAFVGLSIKGQEDLYVLYLETGALRAYTDTIYSIGSVDWGPEGILVTSDETATGTYDLFVVDPDQLDPAALPLASLIDRPGVRRLTADDLDQEEARWGTGGRVLFQAAQVEPTTIYGLDPGAAAPLQLTASYTEIKAPQMLGDQLYAVGLVGGEYHIYKYDQDELLAAPVQTTPLSPEGEPQWIETAAIDIADEREPYTPWKASNWRIDVAQAVLSSSQAGGTSIQFSDLLRDHALIVQLGVYGEVENGDFLALYLNRKRRLEWGAGLVHTVTVRRDERVIGEVPGAGYPIWYRQREFGLVGQVRYPFETFAHVAAGISLLGTKRYDFFDPNGLGDELLEDRYGLATEPEFEAYTRIGIDTLRYNIFTGPISGSSALLILSGAYLPQQPEMYGTLRIEVLNYLRIWKLINLRSRLGMGLVSNSRFVRPFYLISVENLRGFRSGDDRLIGNNYVVWNEEIQIPLASFFKNAFLARLEGVAGFDIGSVTNERSIDQLRRHRAGNVVLGINFALTPFVLRLHYAKAFDVGGDEEYQPTHRGWLANFSIGFNF